MKENKKRIKNGDSYVCPVCGKYRFEIAGDGDVCRVCGWNDSVMQYNSPDETYLENLMSLNQARKAYAEGKPIE